MGSRACPSRTLLAFGLHQKCQPNFEGLPSGGHLGRAWLCPKAAATWSKALQPPDAKGCGGPCGLLASMTGCPEKGKDEPSSSITVALAMRGWGGEGCVCMRWSERDAELGRIHPTLCWLPDPWDFFLKGGNQGSPSSNPHTHPTRLTSPGMLGMESEAGDLPQPSLGPGPFAPGSGWFSASQEVLSIAPCLTRSPAGQAPRLAPLPPLQSEITTAEHKADTNNKLSAGSQQLRWASLFPHPSSIYFQGVLKHHKPSFQSWEALNGDTRSCPCLSPGALLYPAWDSWGRTGDGDILSMGTGWRHPSNADMENVPMGTTVLGSGYCTREVRGLAGCREGPRSEVLPWDPPASREMRLNELGTLISCL